MQTASFNAAPAYRSDQLGGYRIVDELASGGMGTVYLAHRVGPGGFEQPSAVKVIHPHLAKETAFVEMFLDEARITSCVHHPNVCKVLDFGEGNGSFYMAMEYVLGETWFHTLATLRKQELGVRAVPVLLAYVLAQACEGLHAAHEARDHTGRPLEIVHRDVSPQNLLVGYDGSVRVLDFGIASAADRLHTTRDGAVKGRYSYMSPEQMTGRRLDRRSDLWSLGVMLVEGLVGRNPFRRASDAETIHAVTQGTIPPWYCPEQPALQRIASKALSRDLDRRYQTARELGQDLMRFASSQKMTIGMPELSGWMHSLFAERLREKREALHNAAQNARRSLVVNTGTHRIVSNSAPAPSLELTPPVNDNAVPDTVVERLPMATTSREAAVVPPQPAALAMVKRGGVIALAMLLGGVLALAPREPASPPRPAAPLAQQTEAANAAPAQPPITVEEINVMPEALAAAVLVAAVEPAAAEQPGAASGASRSEASKRAAPGTLNITTSSAWADVYLGRRKLGSTPGQFSLPPGIHVLKLRRQGNGPEQSERVVVRSGQTTKTRITLE